MSRALKLLCLYLLFTVEIRVHAFELADLPEGCAAGTLSPCAIRFLGKGAVHIAQSEVSMNSSGLVVVESPNRFRFIQGVLFARTVKQQEIHTLYADIKIDSHSEILLERKGHVFHLSVLKGRAVIERLLEKQPDSIPAGFTIAIGPMALGHVLISLPEAVDLRELIATLADLRPLSITALRDEVEGWREAISAARDLTGQGFAKLAIRQIASAQAAEVRQRQDEQRAEAERVRLHKLFRSRSNLQD